MNIDDNSIRNIEDLEDGSSVYEIGEIEPKQVKDAFSDNLAVNDMSESSLKKLSNYLLDSIEEDITVRKDWLEPVEKIRKYLGFSLEELENIPFKEATRTFDTTLANALIRFYSIARAELLPELGPAGFRIDGNSTEELDKEGEQIRDWLNYYLTVTDNGYYPDFEKALLYIGFYGCVFKKVYKDRSLDGPKSRFITPTNFIVDSDCTSILESNRLTHILYPSKREIILNQQNGIYKSVELSYLKSLENTENLNDSDLGISSSKNSEELDLSAYSKRSLFPIYEVHTYLNLDDFSDNAADNKNPKEYALPLPYIVSIDKTTKEILSIRRNWDENDPEKKRINFFVQYNYLPGFGIYGIGLAHLIGSNAISLTKILRQLVDAGSFKNLPGGLRQKGFKQQQNDIIVGPGQFIEVDTGGIQLRDAFMPLPYSEPSQALRELRIEIMNQTKELGSTSEMGMLDSREDIPTGTAMAFLETNNRIQSAVLRSLHNSLSQELQLIDKLFRSSLENNDINERIQIIPIADPALNSTIQRYMKAQAAMQTAMQAPELHNLPEVFKLNYEAMGLEPETIDKILKPVPQEDIEVIPLDPITENFNSMKGDPLKAAIWQDHAAHIYVHGVFAQENPDIQPVLMAHIREHKAFEYLVKMQELLGVELPPLEEIESPEIQNSIAVAIAKELENSRSEQDEVSPPLDPNALLLADIQQKEAETEARERIANLKAETDVFKAQLDFEREKAKIESQEDIAKLKSETELTKQEINNANY